MSDMKSLFAGLIVLSILCSPFLLLLVVDPAAIPRFCVGDPEPPPCRLFRAHHKETP